MSDFKKSKDANDILSEFQNKQESEPEPEPTTLIETESKTEPIIEPEPEPELITDSIPEPESDASHDESDSSTSKERNVIFVGVKPIMTYVTATLTQLSTRPSVTIKARGKRITQAVDVSQMIVKRMDTVGYKISDVRIASDSLKSQDGKQRNVSTIEIDITKT